MKDTAESIAESRTRHRAHQYQQQGELGRIDLAQLNSEDIKDGIFKGYVGVEISNITPDNFESIKSALKEAVAAFNLLDITYSYAQGTEVTDCESFMTNLKANRWRENGFEKPHYQYLTIKKLNK